MGSGVSGGRLVGSGLVGRGGVVLGGLGVLGLTRVRHIGDVARVAILDSVGHGLDAAVGEGHTVATVGGIAVTGLIGIEVNIGVLVLDGVLVLVLGGLIISRLLVGGGLVGGGRGVSRGRGIGPGLVSRHSGDEEDGGEEGLKRMVCNGAKKSQLKLACPHLHFG